MASLAMTMSANAPCRPVPTNLAKPAAQPQGWPSRRRLASPAASSSASSAVTAHPAPDFQLEGGALQRERLLNGLLRIPMESGMIAGLNSCTAHNQARSRSSTGPSRLLRQP